MNLSMIMKTFVTVFMKGQHSCFKQLQQILTAIQSATNKNCLRNVLPADLRVGETLHVVFAGSWSASLLWLLVIIAVVRLALRAWGAVPQLGAHIAIAVIDLSLRDTKREKPELWPPLETFRSSLCRPKVVKLPSYPLVGAPASGQHEDILHLPLLLLLLNYAALFLWDYIIPIPLVPLIKLLSALFHAREIGHLQQ